MKNEKKNENIRAKQCSNYIDRKKGYDTSHSTRKKEHKCATEVDQKHHIVVFFHQNKQRYGHNTACILHLLEVLTALVARDRCT